MADKGVDGTPSWAYDEDGYCVCCGNGRWKGHHPLCALRDALDARLWLHGDEEPEDFFEEETIRMEAEETQAVLVDTTMVQWFYEHGQWYARKS